jgi:hypothetical protein
MTAETISPEEAFAQVRAAVSPPSCPAWCVDDDCHDYSVESAFIDETDGYAIARHHRSGPAERPHVDGYEVATENGIRPLSISISLLGEPEDGDSSDARLLIDDLTATANLFDEITAAQR